MPEVGPLLHVTLHVALVLPAAPAVLESLPIETDLRRVILQPHRRSVRRVRVDLVVEFPETALVRRAPGRLRDASRLRVQTVDRHVLVDQPHARAVLLQDLQQDRLHLTTVRAVEVGELDERDGRRARAPDLRPGQIELSRDTAPEGSGIP